MKLSFWTEHLRGDRDENGLYVIVRYDGVPTLHNHDGIFSIPSQETLDIVDSYPSKSVLVLGVWGGTTPNR